jgi:hypothetical protein
MSAFMVGREHIWAIINAHYDYGYDGFDYDAAAKLGQMLWDENKRSVQYRYPDCEGNDLPGPVDCDFVYGKHEIGMGKRAYTPVEILKACQCLNYQSCEHPAWEESQAYRLLESVKSYAIGKLPGYKEAPWSIDGRGE